jgi:predicted Fe-S protein YdhL (DUF1289 family)
MRNPFTRPAPKAAMESPCVDICTIDPATRRCVGCQRTIDEISRWASMDAAERHRIMAELPSRPKAG